MGSRGGPTRLSLAPRAVSSQTSQKDAPQTGPSDYHAFMSRLALLVAVLVSALTAAAAPNHPTLPIGSAAPDFRLPGVDGKTYSLKDFASAKVLAVIFTCNHCPTAQAYEQRIIKLQADFKDRGVALVAIQPNDPSAVRLDELGYTDLSDSFQEMKIRASQRGFAFPYLYDGATQ